MKAIKLINLFILALFCQVMFAQNNDIIKSFDLRMDKSVEKGLNSTNVAKALKIQFKIPENYEFKRQIIKGTKDKTSEKDDLGYVHERYAQYYKGIKIEHSDIRVHYLNDLFVSANGEYIDAPNIDVSVILSKENAIQNAMKYIGAKEYMWEDETENNWLKSTTNDSTVSFYPNAEIIICKNNIDFKDTTFHVAYMIDIFAKEPLSHDYVYIDAKTGNILAVLPILINVNGTAQTRYSGTRTISTQLAGTVYLLRDYSRGNGIETYNLNHSTSTPDAVDFFDTNNNWTASEYHNANKDDGALDAHWGAMMTYDYFKNIHNRNSYDNNNAVLKNYVHYGTNLNGAWWDRQYYYMLYGDGYYLLDIATALDIVAHEIGHGVCKFSADLVYSEESGAINESLSDIWGACVKNWATTDKPIWLIGEDVTLRAPALRSMSNPNAYAQPDTYGGGAYWTGPDAEVHINSGIMNHWFYILSVGKSGINGIGNAYDVTGISISKAEKIAYRAETVYMTANTTFANARTYAIKAANDLYGICSPEVISTANAWYAVGVGNEFISTVDFTNQTVTTDTTVTSDCDINIQNVKVQNGAKLTLEAAGRVNIISGFEVELGSKFEIKK
ncbi:MAG: M4 family metallopeptidase [Dysgonamonadaceae bacterium]|jgi:Zn-dependent metalloprotease|nr:M4 family metallopeptidase [Dysgonamonadaceae bacterium]